MNPRPDAVLFDLFHTLIDVNGAPGEATSQILGLDPVVWNTKIMYESDHHALGTVEDPYESVRLIAHSIDPTLPEERIRLAVEARPRRFRHAMIHVRPEVLQALARIRALGCKIGLISNAGRDEVEAWAESPLSPFFDTALFSCHERLMKPDPAIYLRAAGRLGVSPERCLFVGDGGSSEHEGARRAGMTTVLILGMLEESLPELAARRPRNTDYVIRTPAELAGMLEGWGMGVEGTREGQGAHPVAGAVDPGAWMTELPAAITVTDANGIILEMNAASREVFAADGGEALLGRNVLDCHPEPARTETARLYAERRANHYTISKGGRRKIIHQLPWYKDGVFAGLVELSIPIPEEMPHFDRDRQSPSS